MQFPRIQWAAAAAIGRTPGLVDLLRSDAPSPTAAPAPAAAPPAAADAAAGASDQQQQQQQQQQPKVDAVLRAAAEVREGGMPWASSAWLLGGVCLHLTASYPERILVPSSHPPGAKHTMQTSGCQCAECTLKQVEERETQRVYLRGFSVFEHTVRDYASHKDEECPLCWADVMNPTELLKTSNFA
jgi:hypothetical protein